MKNRKTLLVVLVLAILVGVFFVCWHYGHKERSVPDNPDNNVVKIGVVLPLDGGSAKLGVPKKRAFEIAMEQFNKDGVKMEALFEESFGTSTGGTSAFKKLLKDKDIDCYYIDLTTIVNACVPIINEHKVITFAGSAEPEITEQSDYLFRIFAGGEQEVDMMVEYLRQQVVQNVFVLHTNELYGNNATRYFKDKFAKIGGKVLGDDAYPMNNNDFKTQLTKVKEAKPEKVVLMGYGNEYPTLFRQALEYDMSPDLFVCNLGGSNKSVMELPAELIEGMAFIGPRFSYLLDNNMLEPQMQEFVDLYRAKYTDENPDFRAAYAYDMIVLFMDVYGDGSKTDQQIMDELKTIKNYKGVSGSISFKANGDSETDLVAAKYVNGKMVLIEL